MTPGGLVIVSSTTRTRKPSRIIGHPDLASGASVQRHDTLYVSIAEAIYRENQGEDVEMHFVPTTEDEEALSDLRSRARKRWENDRLPDGWTRPLPPTPKDAAIGVISGPDLPAELQSLAAQLAREHSDS